MIYVIYLLHFILFCKHFKVDVMTDCNRYHNSNLKTKLLRHFFFYWFRFKGTRGRKCLPSSSPYVEPVITSLLSEKDRCLKA